MHYEQQTCSLVQREGCRICRTTVQLDVYLIAPFCTQSHAWNGDKDVLFCVADTWLTCGQVAHFWMKIPVWIVAQHFTVTITILWKKNRWRKKTSCTTLWALFRGPLRALHLKIAVSPRSSSPQQQEARINGCFRRLAEWSIRQKRFGDGGCHLP